MDYKAENQHLLPKEISFIPSTLSQIHGKFEWVATMAKLVLNIVPTFPFATLTREDIATMKMYLSFFFERAILLDVPPSLKYHSNGFTALSHMPRKM